MEFDVSPLRSVQIASCICKNRLSIFLFFAFSACALLESDSESTFEFYDHLPVKYAYEERLSQVGRILPSFSPRQRQQPPAPDGACARWFRPGCSTEECSDSLSLFPSPRFPWRIPSPLPLCLCCR